jgi:hypothetical protein
MVTKKKHLEIRKLVDGGVDCRSGGDGGNCDGGGHCCDGGGSRSSAGFDGDCGGEDMMTRRWCWWWRYYDGEVMVVGL